MTAHQTVPPAAANGSDTSLEEKPSRERYRFGNFEIDPHSGELFDAQGSLVLLPPQPFKVLSLLVRRGDDLVTREEICNEVWGAETFVDFDKGLNFCILQIRNALGDDAKNPQYIETLPRRGYRLIPRVEIVGDANAGDPPPVRVGRPRSHALLLALLGVAIAATLFLLVRRPGPTHVAQPAGRVMIAVLPFEHFGSGEADLYFSEGITEEVTSQLGSLHPARLGVIARTSASAYRGTTQDMRKIGRDLGVRYLLEGSVRRGSDQTIRITAQLIDARDGTHLWAREWDHKAGDTLQIQTAIAAEVARTLEFRLLDSRRGRQPSAVAHDEYLKGRYRLHRGSTEDLFASLEHFERAIASDAGFALPLVAQVEALHYLEMRGRIDTAEARRRIAPAVVKALELAPDQAGSHGAAGLSNFWYQWRFDEAEQEFGNALRINPSDPGAHHDRGWLLIARGHLDEGIAEMRLAQRLDPLSPRANTDVAWALIYAGRFDQAIQESRRIRTTFPEFTETHRCLEAAWLGRGDESAALASLREWAEATGRTEDLALLDPSTPAESLRRFRRAHLVRLETRARVGYVDPFDFAHAFARLGEREKALSALEEALEVRSTGLVLMRVDPALASLRDDKRFAAVARKVGL